MHIERILTYFASSSGFHEAPEAYSLERDIKEIHNRGILNEQDIVKKLTVRFNVPVDTWGWNGETFEEEFFMLQKYTMCISVCGGTSMSCTFLPDGAANIYFGSWDSETYEGRPGRSLNMDGEVWTWDQRHKSYSYPVLLNETLPDHHWPKDYRGFNYSRHWKHNLGFNVVFDRLAVLVNDGLRYSEARIGSLNSFRMMD